MIDPKGFLMIEPLLPAEEAIVDELTQKVANAWNLRETNPRLRFRGWHTCVCGARSDNRVHYARIGGELLLTNSLCVHYIARHRGEITLAEIKKIELISQLGIVFPEDLH